MTLRILGLSGNVTHPSRTAALTRTITERIGAAVGSDHRAVIELVEVAPVILSALTQADLGGTGRAIVDQIERADLLVVATPVYRASYTGALKHLFDLVDQRALAGKPVALAATGGSQLHGLVTEHQLRPLLSFFGALTLPTTLYAVEADFEAYRLTNPAIEARIERVAQEAASALGPSSAARLQATTLVPVAAVR